MSKNRLTLAVGALVLLVLLLRMTVYTVEDPEVAVVLTFGEPTSEEDEPGAGVKWPWPVQEVKQYDRRLRVYKGPLEELTTSDKQTILVGSFLLWRVKSAKTFLRELGKEEVAEQRLERVLRSHQAAAISARRFDQLVSADPSKLKYADVEASMLEGIQTEVAEWGIEVELVGIRRLGLPKAVTHEVFERMKEDRKKKAEAILDEGRTEAKNIKNRAQGKRDRLLAEAERKASKIKADAERRARPHYEKLAKDPDLAIFLKKLEALRKLLKGKSTTLVFDSNDPPFDLLRSSTAPVKSRD